MKKYLFIKLSLLLMIPVSGISQTGERWYYNIDENNLAVQGYDVVEYFTKNKAIQGVSNFTESYRKIVYYFSSYANQKKFRNNPESYLPQSGGWCSYAMSVDRNKDGFAPSRFPSDPTNFKIIDNKLYLFTRIPNFDGLAIWNQGNEKILISRAGDFWQSRLDLAKLSDGLPDGLNVNARMENLQWQKFMGTWESSVQWMRDTTSRAYSPKINAKWHFYYGYHGYAIQDDWFPINYANGNGITSGPAIRGYNPLADEWHMTYIPINSARNNTWLMTANFNEKGEVEGSLENVDANGNKFIQRIYFYDVSENKFTWRADRSYNNGKTWIKTFAKSTQTRFE